MKQVAGKLSDVILAAQPLFATGIYLTFLVGNPPLWTSWCIALIPWVIRFWRTGKLFKRTPFDIPILVFIIGIIIGYFVSPDKVVSWPGLHTYLASIFIFYGIVSNSEAKANYWLILGGILCLLILGLTIYTFFQGDNRYYFFNEWISHLPKIIPKIGAFKPSYNTAGAALGIAIPFLLALTIFQRQSRLRLGIIGTLFLFLALLFLNGSGGAWLSVIIGIIFVLTCRKLWTLAVTIPVIGFGGWAIAASLNKDSSLAQTWVTKMFPLSSITERINLWQDTINFLNNHIITGPGLGIWYELYRSNGGKYALNAHNTYLQLYFDAGLLGGIAMVGAAVVFVYICWHILRLFPKRNWNGLAIGIIGSMLAGMVNAVFEVNTSALILNSKTFVNYLAIPYLWLWAAFLVVAYFKLRPERNMNH